MRALFILAAAGSVAVPGSIVAAADVPAVKSKRVDIGGRAINLSCSGSGSPVVVVDACMGTAPAGTRAGSASRLRWRGRPGSAWWIAQG
jgi:hypothetical protein